MGRNPKHVPHHLHIVRVGVEIESMDAMAGLRKR